MKKIVALVLALVLCASMVAFAEEVPSKTVSDLASAEILTEGCEGLSLIMSPVADDWMVAKVTEMATCGNPIEALDADALAAAGADNTWTVNEAYAFSANGYKDEMGDVAVAFEFPTQLADGTPAAAIFTFEDGTAAGVAGNVADGKLQVSLTKDLLSRLNSEPAMINIVSAPQA